MTTPENRTDCKGGTGSDWLAGLKAGAPIWLSMFAFGIVAGVLGVKLGLTPLGTGSMSLIIFAGSAQLAAFQLFHDAAPPIIILLTVLVINLRFSMYSASLAPHFQQESKWRKLLVAYLLTDQAYVVSELRFQKGTGFSSKFRFYIALALSLWATWQLGTFIGAYSGAHVPAQWGFTLAAPLTFLALMFSALRNRPTVLAAVISGIVAVITDGVPWHLNMMLGALAGVISGLVLSSLTQSG